MPESTFIVLASVLVVIEYAHMHYVRIHCSSYSQWVIKPITVYFVSTGYLSVIYCDKNLQLVGFACKKAEYFSGPGFTVPATWTPRKRAAKFICIP